MELNAKFREWSRGIAESEQTFLGKAEACVGVVVKEDSPDPCSGMRSLCPPHLCDSLQQLKSFLLHQWLGISSR